MPQIDPKVIEELRSTPIEGVAARLNIPVRNHKCLCPFHGDRNPSGSFKNNHFRCWSCGAEADVIGFVQQVLGVGFKDAVKFLAEESNVIINTYSPPVAEKPKYPPDVEYLAGLVRHPVLNDEAQEWLSQRGYNPSVVKWLGLSSISKPTPCWRYGKPFYDAPSLMIPYRSISGQVLNVQSRYLGTDQTKPRFRFPSANFSSIHVFNLPVLQRLKSGDQLWLAEGPSDTIAHLSDGHKCIGIPSATTLKTQDLHILKPFVDKLGVTLHFSADNDFAGKQLQHLLSTACEKIGLPLEIHPLPEGIKDYSELYMQQHRNNH